MAIYLSCVITSLSASNCAALTICLRSVDDILLMRALESFDSFMVSPHAVVTMLAVKFSAIGTLTIEINASTLIGFETGTAAAN